VPDLEGGDRQQLDDGRMARHRGAEKYSRRSARQVVAALSKIVASKDYTEFMGKQGYGVIYAPPDDFAKFMAKSDADLGATMKAVGIVK
jgi:tripartite-type tricarboxylate transporter receptor subunit TctC